MTLKVLGIEGNERNSGIQQGPEFRIGNCIFAINCPRGLMIASLMKKMSLSKLNVLCMQSLNDFKTHRIHAVVYLPTFTSLP